MKINMQNIKPKPCFGRNNCDKYDKILCKSRDDCKAQYDKIVQELLNKNRINVKPQNQYARKLI